MTGLNAAGQDLKSDRFAVAMTRWILARQIWVVSLLLLLFGVSLWGVSKLTFSNDYRIFFSEENPELQDFVEFQDVYGQSDSIIFVIHNPDGAILTQDIVPDMEWLVESAEEIPYVSRVEALTNSLHIRVEDDDLTVEAFVQDSDFLTEDDYRLKQSEALNNPQLIGNLLSANGQTTAIHIIFELPLQSAEEVLNAAAAVRDLSAQFQELHPQLEVGLSGIIMLNTAFSEAGISDVFRLLPAMFLLLFIALLILLRNIYASFIIIISISYSSAFALGMAGFLGIPITVVSVSSLIIIMTLAVANSMHLLVAAMDEGSQQTCNGGSADIRAAIIHSLKINFLPISLTSLTTIISFLSLNFSDAPPYWHLGNITAMGVFAAWLISLTLLPLLMQGLSLKPTSLRHMQRQQRMMQRIALWVVGRHKPLFFVGMMASVLLISALPKLEFNDEFISYFSDNIEFRRDADFMQQHLSGLYTVEYHVPAAGEQGIFTLEYSHNLEAFANWLRQQPEVHHVYSYTDILKRLNTTLSAESVSSKGALAEQLPIDEETAAQYFLMYEFSLGNGDDLENRISLDKSSSRLTAIIDNLSSLQMQAFVAKADLWQKAHWPIFMQAPATGPAVMFAYVSKRNIDSMVMGNILAVAIITLLLLLLLRSWSLGLVSLLANAMPILMMFGLWALVVGEVGMVGTTIAAATLGIVVDDTIHFLSKYLRAKRYDQKTTVEAIHATFSTVGVAIVSTTIVLVVGLSTLIASDFQLNQQAGLLTVITIIFALLFDFLILPAGLISAEHLRKKRE
ncbi:MAG: MMPL family transporter [Pseudomonadales bacterium]|nr:MMPL family transporter [Pseudomonadales bacterium]